MDAANIDPTDALELDAADIVLDDAPVVAADPAPAEDDVAFTFDGEPGEDDQPDDSAVIRALRERTREQARRLKELEAKAPAQTEEQVGPEPTMESCGYDEDEFKAAVKAWTAKQSAEEAKKDAAKRAQEEQQQAWAKRVIDFEAKAVELRIPAFVETAQEVGDHFGDDLNGQYAKALLVMANDPRMVAALKASPAKLAELVAMKNDPAGLAIAIGELKGKIKAMPRRSIPAPETMPRGGAPKAPEGEDKALAKLEEEAERTGSRTKVIEYKRALKAKSA